jgi:hypothetical protein
LAGPVGRAVGDDLASAPGAAPGGAVLVDEDPARVGVDVVAVVEPVPGEVELGQADLHEVLGGVIVAREE